VIHKKQITKMRQMVTEGKMRLANTREGKSMEHLSKDGNLIGWN
jgi:hypothetical protein